MCAGRQLSAVGESNEHFISIFFAINKILIEISHYIMIKSFEPKCNFVTI